MSEMRSLNGASDSKSPFLAKRSRSPILEIDSWMPSEIQAISPLVDRLMRLIEGSQCVPGAEPDIELALLEVPIDTASAPPQGEWIYRTMLCATSATRSSASSTYARRA